MKSKSFRNDKIGKNNYHLIEIYILKIISLIFDIINVYFN